MTVNFLIYAKTPAMFFHFHLMPAQRFFQQYKFPWTALQKVMASLRLLSDSLNDICKFLVRKQYTFIYVKSAAPWGT